MHYNTESQDMLTLDRNILHTINILVDNKLQLAKKKLALIQLERELYEINLAFSVYEQELDPNILSNAILEQEEKQNSWREKIQHLQKKPQNHITDEVALQTADLVKRNRELKESNLEQESIKLDLEQQALTLRRTITELKKSKNHLNNIFKKTEQELLEVIKMTEYQSFLELDKNFLMHCLFYATDMGCKLSMHLRLGFIEREAGNKIKAYNHFRMLIQSNNSKYHEIVTIFEELKRDIEVDINDLSIKNLHQISLRAFDAQQYDEAICYAEMLIERSNNEHILVGSALLFSIYLTQELWINLDLVYSRLIQLSKISKKTQRKLLEMTSEEKKSIVRSKLEHYTTDDSHYSKLKILELSSTIFFKDMNKISDATIEFSTYNAISTYASLHGISDLECTSSEVYVLMNMNFIYFLFQNSQFEEIQRIVDVMNSQEIPALAKAWFNYRCGEYLSSKTYVIDEEQEDYELIADYYKQALTYDPYFTEARVALQELSLKNKIVSVTTQSIFKYVVEQTIPDATINIQRGNY